jgi:G3E family GTPase
MARTVKIALITGYLGAGKTTLLNHILSNDKGIRAAVIVNDIGEVNVDATLIEDTGVVTQVDDSLVPLTNGCICCTLADDLARQLTDLAESGKYDHIIIEASGICEPIPIAFTIDNFCKQEAMRGVNIKLDNIIAVVDCARMFDEFNGGEDLLAEGIDDEDLEALLIQQIEFCTTLVLNKTDTVTPQQVAELRAIVRGLQKDAKIIEATQGEVDLDELLNTGRFDFEEAYESAAWIDAMEHPEEHDDPEVLEYDIATFVYLRRRPFDMDKLEGFARSWPESVIRVKGLVWFENDYNMAYVFEQAGRQIHLQENGLFVASAPEEDFKRIVAQNPEVLDDWDDEVGDRMTKLVFIGRHMDQDAIVAGLDACLV